MQFWLFDHSSNDRSTITCDADSITVGRDKACDIVLASPFVARRHAKIYRKGNQWFVEAIGRSGTRVANREVPTGESTKLEFGDELQLGQFSLAMVRPDQDTKDKDEDQSDQQRQLMDFEQRIHAELLDRMNLRVTGHLNKSDNAFVNQTLVHLDETLREEVPKLSEPVAAHCIRGALHRMVVAEVVRQCQGKVETDYTLSDQQLDPEQERSLSSLVTSMVDMMPLLFDAASVQEDLAVAEEAFDDLFEQTLPTMPPDLRAYVIRRTVSKDIRDILFGLGPLQDLLDMANVSEIMVVGKDRIYVEKNGVIQPTTRSFFSDEVLLSVIERILTPVGRRVDQSTPLVDARLSDGSRVNVIINPLSLVGPCITIRKFGWMPFTIDDLIDRHTLSERCAEFLQGCILGRKNIVISGGTGSGKTTLLNVLSAYARPNERIVTIEESAELKLPQPHVVALEGRPANVEGKGQYTIRELVRNALRMRPDRIIVGEVRGAEALDMLQAMNTGHDGSLSTLHANTPTDAAKRFETMVLMAIDMPVRAIREQIVGAVDLVVQLQRLSGGDRRITHVSEVIEIDRETSEIRLEDIYTLRDPQDTVQRHTGYMPTFAQTMIDRKQIGVEVFL